MLEVTINRDGKQAARLVVQGSSGDELAQKINQVILEHLGYDILPTPPITSAEYAAIMPPEFAH